MAINIAQQPTTPNCTYTNLVYQVTSSNATEPQFQYVMDVYVSGSATRLARIRQFPNQLNQAVFDPSRIMNDNLEYSTLLTPTVTYVVNDVTDTIKTFDVQFGEEYGTSATSSTTCCMQGWPRYVTLHRLQSYLASHPDKAFASYLVSRG